MNYKEKYEQGLECIQEILSGAGDTIRTSILQKRLQPFFPELKESKDERIRKGLIKAVSRIFEGHKLFDTDVTREEALAWLEKQGKKSTIIDIDKMVMEYSQTKDGDFGLPVNCMIRAYRKGINDALSIELNIKKQGEKGPCANCINDKGCLTCENGNLKETKATQKVKTLDANKVIAWLVANICEFEYYVKLFKKDFGL